MEIFLWILLLVIVIAIDWFLATLAANIADQKGYDDEHTKFFWICFLFGIIGYILVAALPDRNLQTEIKHLAKAMQSGDSDTTSTSSTSTPQSYVVPAATTSSGSGSGFWQCPSCGEKNYAGTMSCKSCGKYR